MPRDLIIDEAAMYDVQVSWKRGEDGDGHVQLGVETHSGRSISEMLTAEGETPADFTGLWGTLSEESITKLIRTLQKAKRQAFPNVNAR